MCRTRLTWLSLPPESLLSSISKTRSKKTPLSTTACPGTDLCTQLHPPEQGAPPAVTDAQSSRPGSQSGATGAVGRREKAPNSASTNGVTRCPRWQAARIHTVPLPACHAKTRRISLISAGDRSGAMPKKLLCMCKILNKVKRLSTLKVRGLVKMPHLLPSEMAGSGFWFCSLLLRNSSCSQTQLTCPHHQHTKSYPYRKGIMYCIVGL